MDYDKDYNIGDTLQFSAPEIRQGFIRKVFSILMAQLAITAAIVGIFVTESMRQFARQNIWLLWLSFFASLVCIIMLACFERLRRQPPHNFFILGVFTVCEGVLLGFLCAKYDRSEILIAVGICAIVCFSLIVFATQTRIDFTLCNGVMMVVLLIFVIFGIFAIIFPSKIMMLVYSCIGALIFSIYLVIDIQMIIGGKHRYTYSPEEYIFAALNIYIDIVHIFIYILNIVSYADSN